MKIAALGFTAALVGGLLLSAPVVASPITCPVDADRQVTIEDGNGLSVTGFACGASGITSNQNEGSFFADLGLTELEKIDAIEDEDENVLNPTDGGSFITLISGLGGTNGSFSLLDGLTDIVLVFKFGAGQTTPDWISFVMDGPTSLTGGLWSVNQSQALSHVTLYGKLDRPPEQVPEPGVIALLAIGLLGLGLARRRRLI